MSGMRRRRLQVWCQGSSQHRLTYVLAGLRHLKHLELHNPKYVAISAAPASRLVCAHVWCLTALTGLTFLGLPGRGSCVGDIRAGALACCLKQLRHMDLRYCELGGMACLGPIAHLQLTELQLQGNTCLTQQWLLPGTPVAIKAAGRPQPGVLVGGLAATGTAHSAHTKYRVLLGDGKQPQRHCCSDA